MKYVYLIFNICLLIPIAIFGINCLGYPGASDFYGLISLVIFTILINLFMASLNRISNSKLSELAKPCWIFIILLFPIFGAISALIIVKEKKNESAA